MDGLDSNGDVVINGGYVFISVNGDSMNNAIDYGSESGGSCYLNGGTVIAAGSGGMAESISSESAQYSLMYNFEAANAAGSRVRLLTAEGEILLEAEIPCSFSSLVLSGPALAEGESYVLAVDDTEYEVTMTEKATQYGSSGGMGGFGGHGGGQGGMGGFGGFGRAHGFGGKGGTDLPAEDAAGEENQNSASP